MKKTMREMFKGYSDYSDEEYKKIWEKSKIVIDTNILLNFYRYSNETRNELYQVLKSLKERLWIPYQVAKEYFDNKQNAIADSLNNFEKLEKRIETSFEDMIKDINAKPEKQLKNKKSLIDELNDSKKKIKDIIKQEKENRKKGSSEEEVEKLIFELFDGSVGEKIVDKEYEEMKNEGKRRFDASEPPGYKDSDKEENGDYYIFYSIIKYAKECEEDIIFVTDDVKEDWFMEIRGEKKGADYRLLNEFFNETGKLLLIYTSDGFLKSYQQNVADPQKINKNVLEELKSTRSIDDDKILIEDFNELVNYVPGVVGNTSGGIHPNYLHKYIEDGNYSDDKYETYYKKLYSSVADIQRKTNRIKRLRIRSLLKDIMICVEQDETNRAINYLHSLYGEIKESDIRQKNRILGRIEYIRDRLLFSPKSKLNKDHIIGRIKNLMEFIESSM